MRPFTVTGTLIAPGTYRSALAASVSKGGAKDQPWLEVLDKMVAAAILEEDPDPSPIGTPTNQPEPRFIHLADVVFDRGPTVPFMRLRLPAVSGFWLEPVTAIAAAEPLSEGR